MLNLILRPKYGFFNPTGVGVNGIHRNKAVVHVDANSQ
jgi:hypothetical protein